MVKKEEERQRWWGRTEDSIQGELGRRTRKKQRTVYLFIYLFSTIVCIPNGLGEIHTLSGNILRGSGHLAIAAQRTGFVFISSHHSRNTSEDILTV